MSQYKTKQVIVMRTDLNMRKGKMAAQAGHASLMFLSRKLQALTADGILGLDTPYPITLSKVEREWLNSSYAKICVGVESEEKLQAIIDIAYRNNIECNPVIDNGTPEFHGVKTLTCWLWSRQLR